MEHGFRERKYRGHSILAVNVINENDFNTLDDLFEITEKLIHGETMYFTREALEKYDSLMQPLEGAIYTNKNTTSSESD